MRGKYVAELTTRMSIHGWLLVGCTHDRSVPIRPDGNVDLCGRVHSVLHLSQPIWINEWERIWNGRHCADQMYTKHSFTLLMPFIDASNNAIFASSNALPPRTARNWNPIGTRTIPRAVIPKAIIGSICCLCRCRARSTSISNKNKKSWMKMEQWAPSGETELEFACVENALWKVSRVSTCEHKHVPTWVHATRF